MDKIKSGEKFVFEVHINNESDIDGSEVVQLYIRDKLASMTRPLRELKDFKKIFISSNNQETLEFEIGFDQLGFYDFNGKFEVEPGEFDIFIGNDCYADKAYTIKVI